MGSSAECSASKADGQRQLRARASRTNPAFCCRCSDASVRHFPHRSLSAAHASFAIMGRSKSKTAGRLAPALLARFPVKMAHTNGTNHFRPNPEAPPSGSRDPFILRQAWNLFVQHQCSCVLGRRRAVREDRVVVFFQIEIVAPSPLL